MAECAADIRLRVAIVHRVVSSARRGLTFRSWKSASCLRRKRFSAARALWECAAREASRTRSTTTKDNVRTHCATARKTDACDMNAQDCTLRNVTVARFRIVRTFCGARALESISTRDFRSSSEQLRRLFSLARSTCGAVQNALSLLFLVLRSVSCRCYLPCHGSALPTAPQAHFLLSIP